MKDVARRILTAESDILIREAFGLAVLCAVILAGFGLPFAG